MSAETPVLLAGGNPQIAKGYGEAPVKAYLDAVPAWKNAVCRRLDALISQTIPGVQKAIKWNTPLYGMEQDRWFAAFHCYDKYVKVTFFRGLSLSPVPPVASKMKDTRYLHVAEQAPLDEARFVDWIRQAAALPGEKM